MTPREQRKQSAVAKRARPIRELLQSLVRDRVKTRIEKQKLAEFLGQSVGSLDAMLYRGEGGLDSWISALIYCYELSPEVIKDFVLNYRANVRRSSSMRESDRRWFDLDSEMSEDEKFYWVSLMAVSVKLQRELVKRK